MTDAQWLGACMASESDKPSEWPWVGWVIRNRVEHPSRWRDSYAGVVRQPLQFSFWNQYSHLSDADALAVAQQRLSSRLPEAEACATWLLACDENPIPGTYHFWSPVSMVPPGRLPTWAKRMRRFTPAGVDPWRFMFGEG